MARPSLPTLLPPLALFLVQGTVVWKQIMGAPITLEDFRDSDEGFYSMMVEIRDKYSDDRLEALELRYAVNGSDGTPVALAETKEGDELPMVTAANR